LNNNISNKDKKDWETFLSKNEKLPNKDLADTKKNILKYKEIDLHGYSLNDANKKVEVVINDSFSRGISKLKIITGKGLHSDHEKDPYKSKNFAILKFSIPDFISNNLELMKKINEIKDADDKDGGGGAIYIFLKKNQK